MALRGGHPERGRVPDRQVGDGVGQSGVFAAGDVTNVKDKQVVVAAGEGAKAALRAHEYILVKR